MTTPTNQTQTTKSFKEQYGIEPQDYLSMSKEQRDAFHEARFQVEHPIAYKFFRGFAYFHLILTGVNVAFCTQELFQGDWKNLIWTMPLTALLIYQRAAYSWVKVALPGGHRV